MLIPLISQVKLVTNQALSGKFLSIARSMPCAGHVRQSFAPKLASAEAMAAAMTGLPLRTTVLFSSTAALFGAPGQGNYAAANAALEAWAARRAATGQQAVAVQWGAWAAGSPLCILCH